MTSSSLWQRFQQYFLHYGDLDFSLDISRMKFPDDFFEKMQPRIEKAFAAMRELEAGAIANPGEKRMVGHYWLRNPALAPNAEIRAEIEETIKHIKSFAADVHTGKIPPKMENASSIFSSSGLVARRLTPIRGRRSRINARSNGHPFLRQHRSGRLRSRL